MLEKYRKKNKNGEPLLGVGIQQQLTELLRSLAISAYHPQAIPLRLSSTLLFATGKPFKLYNYVRVTNIVLFPSNKTFLHVTTI